ncbi:hypothetical protein SESBI_33648 [Sesbania bispinosa]|nr:hypothetical protein SESBI_33648 [Sesbania bispinosa]
MIPSLAAKASATRGDGAEMSTAEPESKDPEESRRTTAIAPDFESGFQAASTLILIKLSRGGRQLTHWFLAADDRG